MESPGWPYASGMMQQHQQLLSPPGAMGHVLAAVPEEEFTLRETDPRKGSLRVDECDEEADYDVVRPAKRSRTTFECEHCGTSYTEKRALARHRHTDQHRKKLGLPLNKKHACSVCGKLFGRGHDMKRHLNEQHPESAEKRSPSSGVNATEQASSSSDNGSENAMSIDSSARSKSHLTSITAPSLGSDERGGSSSSLSASFVDDATPPAPWHFTGTTGLHRSGAVRRVKTMENLSDRGNFVSVPSIRMDDIKETDATEPDNIAPMVLDTPLLRPSCSMGDIAPRSEGSSSRLSQYSTENSLRTMTTDSVPDLVPFFPSPPKSKLQASALEGRTLMHSKRPDIDSWQHMTCMMCGIAFEDDPEELLQHLRRHLDIFRGEYRCEECNIGFVHEEDFLRHQDASAMGHCGFNFPHSKPCTGHHPPSTSDWNTTVPDSDCFRLCTKLRHWEQSQLQAYLSEINELIAARKTRKPDRWSVGAIMRGSRNSFRSLAISVNTYASAPCDVATDTNRYDIGGLQARLRQMSLRNASTTMKNIVRKQRSSSSLASSIDTPVPSSVSMDKPLYRAIFRNDLPRASRLIEDQDSSQHTSVQNATGTLTAAALWGRTYVNRYMTDHTLIKNSAGRCEVCGIHGTAPEQGPAKVKLLLRHGADPSEPGGLCGYPLNTAAWMGKPDVAKLLLHGGARVDSLGHGPGTPLCTAAAQADVAGSLAVVRILLAYRADVHTVGPEGRALELALKRRERLLAKSRGLHLPREDLAARIACADEMVRVLEEAEAARSPPLVGTLYCRDVAMQDSGPEEGAGVVLYKSWGLGSAAS